MTHRPKRRRAATPGTLVAGQALRLLRLAPLPALAAYLTGTVPFLIGWLWFWSDMSYGAYAYRRLAGGSLLMALLFLWMKVWQSVFGVRLLAFAADEPAPRWSPRSVMRSLLLQGAIQPFGFLLLPLSMLLTLPFPWCSAFFQNLLVLDSPEAPSARAILQRATRLATLYPGQNLRIIWLLSPWSVVTGGVLIFGVTRLMLGDIIGELGNAGGVVWFILALVVCSQTLLVLAPFGAVIFVNSAVLIISVPYLLNTLFGIQTPFTTVGMTTLFNTTFLAIAFALTYLILAPLFTAAHALRCFEGSSTTDGRDLRVALRRAARSASRGAMLLLLLLTTFTTPRLWAAAATPPDPRALDESISEVLTHPRYTWRMPRERDAAAREAKARETPGWLKRWQAAVKAWIESARDTLTRWVRRCVDWLERWLGSRTEQDRRTPSALWIQAILDILLIAVACVLAILLYRWVRARARRRITASQPLPTLIGLDLESDQVTADQRPSDEWRQLAETLAANAEYRLAVRALFLSMLAHLGKRELVTIARHKANRDYLADLRRRAHDQPETISGFLDAATTVECHWYGRRPTTIETFDALRLIADRLRAPQPPMENPA